MGVRRALTMTTGEADMGIRKGTGKRRFYPHARTPLRSNGAVLLAFFEVQVALHLFNFLKDEVPNGEDTQKGAVIFQNG